MMKVGRKPSLNIHWKDWCWSWSSNTLATWCEELFHWKRPWCWERLKAGGKGDDRGWDGWMASPTQWTWVWASSRSWWWTGRSGMLQFIGLQRVAHDWANEPEKAMAPHSSTLALKIHGQRNLVGYGPWGREESDMTERLHFHFSLSCIGEGNGNPLQCSRLENPRDGEACWAAVHWVAQSRTRLKRLSSSSSRANEQQNMMTAVLVQLLEQITINWVAYQHQNFLTVLEAGRLRSRGQTGRALIRVLSQFAEM